MITEWAVSPGLTPYEPAVAFMEARAAAIADGRAPELVWLLEHPPLYTAGTSARTEDLLDPERFPVFRTGRGGEFTYHGPGQRVGYVMLDLTKRGRDARKFVRGLEAWLSGALARLGVQAGARDGRVGVWVDRGSGREDKIAAIGVRLRRWVSFHGMALNVAPDLTHFSGITPCGISDPRYGVTSLSALGVADGMAAADAALRASWAETFGPVRDAPAPHLSEPA
ncbi:MAG: lipoyl(octanoyl) transferase LipB [Maricaulaceae bacterium]|nr:lipoyl(octanoyl) transferase LipB [Maricaulaceae bacterium]